MSAHTPSDAPESTRSLARTIITLLVTLLCSQLIFLGMSVLFEAAFTGFPWGGQREKAERLTMIALALLMAGPVLLGVYLKPGLRGLLSGFAALVAAGGGGYVVGVLNGIYFYYSLLPDTVRTSLSTGIIHGAMIVTILVVGRKVRTRLEMAGLGLGLLIGTGLSSTVGTLGGWSGVGDLAPWALLWDWLSAVFFPEFLSGRAGWRDLLVWVGMIVVSPFLTVAIFRVLIPLLGWTP